MTRPTALVTGASAGIGAAFAQRLANDGYDLVLVARDGERLEKLATKLPTDTEVLAADLTREEGLAAVEQRLARGVDLLVNNAGFGTFGFFAERPIEEEERMVHLNVVALMRLTRAALPPMLAKGAGGVINVSSLASYQAAPYNAVYSATKAFVTSFSQAVHEEVLGKGVTVTALLPGFTKTEFQERAGVGQSGPGFLWQTADDVVETAMSAYSRRAALAIPGVHNRLAAAISKVAPQVVTRKVAAAIIRRSE